jgi:hypothetical protein
MSGMPAPVGCEAVEVETPPTYILRRHHVMAALARAFESNGMGTDIPITLRIHSTTVGIGAHCFKGVGDIYCVSRIRVRPDGLANMTSHVPDAAVLGAFIRRMASYEPGLVDVVRELAMLQPDEMHRVGMQAFDGCTALREVELPHCITCIGDAAFWGCSNMTKVVLPNSLTHIDRNAFLECTTLQDVVLPNSLTHIGDSAFSECTALDVRLPKSLTHIGRRAFSGCAGLKDITVSRAGTFVGEGAFSCCTGLKSVILPSVVIGERGDNFDNDGRVDACISDSCFVNCCELTELMLSGEITHVGYRAFSGCASLAVLTLVLNLDLSSTSAPSRLQIASA